MIDQVSAEPTTRTPHRARRDGAVLGKGLPVDQRRRPSAAGRRAQRQPLSLLPGQAGRAARGAGRLSGGHRRDAARARRGRTSRTRSSGCLRCSRSIAGRSSRPTARTPVRSEASRSSCTNRIRRSARDWPRTSTPGSTRSSAASSPPATAAARPGPPRARGLRADDDGGRRDARAHVSRRRDVRRGRRPAPPSFHAPARPAQDATFSRRTRQGDR